LTNTSQHAHTYLWDFGDGGTSTETNPVHTYAAPGTYTITLEVTGDCGTDEFAAVVTVSRLPLAGFTHNAPVCLDEPVVFTNTSSNADTFLWAFGDGTTATETHPMHTYTATGIYTASLEACRGVDCDTVMDTVTIRPLPTAAFTWTADLLTVTFTNASQEATAYLWAFGDSGTSTETHPVHTYAASGTYSVALTATGVCGEDVVTYDVPVSEQPPEWHIYLPIVVR
jgi:PKD repeat protein